MSDRDDDCRDLAFSFTVSITGACALFLITLLVGCSTPQKPTRPSPPMPPGQVSRNLKTVSPKFMAVPAPSAVIIAPPALVTNGMVWTQMMPYVRDGSNTIVLNVPRWLKLDRLNTNTMQWTNCYDGPLTNGQYFFNSSAPPGVLPEYRATVEFKNAR